MDKFLPFEDDAGRMINAAAAELHSRLLKIDANKLGMPEHCLAYFVSSHSKRLFFSTETSAHILYRSIRLTGKPISEIAVMDYGAGVGTLFLLAKMIGCKKVVYSDHLEDWRISAELIANATGITVDHYIVGDIGECLSEIEQLNIHCDIIASRNVVEHIYKLDVFYSSIHSKQPRAIVFSSTTANKSNPAAAATSSESKDVVSSTVFICSFTPSPPVRCNHTARSPPPTSIFQLTNSQHSLSKLTYSAVSKRVA